ncbi:hypothetical protein BFP72_16380 [Reichenbachiella sp. 5M10]|uniref:type III pantothenate kinase n=1 Tax=Reichenbachiella sp. 5M10 TaxID=1889772 RepID=UPI000C14A84D|nr:type III pantothenate kinase [Reichenbachiella sp. 5M10]PIB36864.1 hypothetical protein BFP72_16380 [Reichenbachiella sp. 5M10]
MRTVAVDIGNTKIKIGCFEGDQLLNILSVSELSEARELLLQFAPIHIISCSVAATTEEQRVFWEGFEVLYLSHETPLPIQNLYETPTTLGLDRLAAVVGAESLSNQKDQLIIDIGTCITYDFLDRKQNYHGGSISPGIELRFKSMNDYTRNLPLIESFDEVKLIGKSTRQALISGVINGITAELEGVIAQYKQNWPDLQVILCGGGTNRFESKLKESIFAAPELVLVGLKRILEYNEHKK